MSSFLRRPSRLMAVLSLAMALGACSMPENNGFTQTRGDAQPFADAHSSCWEVAMGSNAGGSSQFGGQMSGYDRCMGQAGWERSKSAF
jgi:hypothetical protein